MSSEATTAPRDTVRTVLFTLLAALCIAAAGIATLTVPPIPGASSALPWAAGLQTATVILVGLVLGWRRALVAVLIVGIAIAAGAPVGQTWQTGRQIYAGPHLGYFASLPLVALLVGLGVQRSFPRYNARFAWWTSIGSLCVFYAAGISWAIWGRAHSPLDATLTALGRLPADVVFVGCAVLLAKLVYLVFPRVIEDRWWNRACPPVPDSLRGEDVPVDARGMVRG